MERAVLAPLVAATAALHTDRGSTIGGGSTATATRATVTLTMMIVAQAMKPAHQLAAPGRRGSLAARLFRRSRRSLRS